MSANAEVSADDAPVISDLEAPAEPVSSLALVGPPVPPQQRIYFYSSEEWEQFIREWASGLSTQYVQIKRLGGPHDRGVDVAAFKTVHGFQGCWDCYQGKHYASALMPSDAIPEILKLFLGVICGHYILPDRYAFLAPRGCGSTLNRLLSNPATLRDSFIKSLQPGSATTAGLDSETACKIRDLASSTDFSLFQSIELLDALDVHRSTPYYTARFGGPLAPRPPTEPPPDDLDARETRYVARLVEVYSENDPSVVLDKTSLSNHPTVGRHFQRQRFAFYRAEALRLYARDSVPEGTFTALQDDIHAGVIEVAESDHASGMIRLTQVLALSGQLDLGNHTLISVANLEDRKGICHQLANEDRLHWTMEGQ